MTTNDITTGERWLDIGTFGWLVRYEHSDVWMDFHAYESIGQYGPPGNEKLFAGIEHGGNEPVEDPTDAESLSGHVKWDGCAQYDIDGKHFCGRDGVEEFGRVLLAIHELAAEVLPKFDRESAGYPS